MTGRLLNNNIIDPEKLRAEFFRLGYGMKETAIEAGIPYTNIALMLSTGTITDLQIKRFEKIGIMPEAYLVRRKTQAKPSHVDTAAKKNKPCKTCYYRGASSDGIGCEYIIVTGKRRGCKAENCDKYKKGDRRRTPLSLSKFV